MASKRTQQMNGSILSSSNDALIFTTMCFVGLPVEVQVKDGSIYAGIFHTACIEKDYGVVLKMARMIRRGINTENLVGGAIIDTLVVLPEDLVQVAAKGVLLPSDGQTGDTFNEDKVAVNHVSATVQPPNFDFEREVNLKSAKLDENDPKRSMQESLVDGQHKSMIKSEGCVQTGCHNPPPGGEKAVANGFKTTSACLPHNSEETKGKASGVPCTVEEASDTTGMDDERQDVQHGLQEERNSSGNGQKQSEETLVHEVQCSVSPNIVQIGQSVTTMETSAFLSHVKPGDIKPEKVPCDVPLTDACPGSSPSKVESVEQLRNSVVTVSHVPTSNTSTSSPSSADSPSASPLSSVPSITGYAVSKNPICNQSSKEFKLNPGAKVFSPSSMNLRAPTSTVSNVDQVLDISMLPTLDGQPGIQLRPPVPHAGLPVKYAPHSNLAPGNGGSYSQNPQPFFGHISSRSQPMRYIVQYMPPQGGSMYVHPSNQTVMVGRMGPVVYAPSISQESVHGVSALPQGLVRPLLSAHQPLLPKHHGAVAQPVQFCMVPQFAPGIHQPLVLPNHLPISQPFPAVRPVPVASGTGVLGSKFAM